MEEVGHVAASAQGWRSSRVQCDGRVLCHSRQPHEAFGALPVGGDQCFREEEPQVDPQVHGAPDQDAQERSPRRRVGRQDGGSWRTPSVHRSCRGEMWQPHPLLPTTPHSTPNPTQPFKAEKQLPRKRKRGGEDDVASALNLAARGFEVFTGVSPVVARILVRGDCQQRCWWIVWGDRGVG